MPAKRSIDFTNAVADQPKHAKAWYYRGVSRDAIGDHTGAVHDLDRALLLDPNNANALLRRAEVHLRARKFKLASADIETLLSTHPSGPIAEHALFTKGENRHCLRRPHDRQARVRPPDHLGSA